MNDKEDVKNFLKSRLNDMIVGGITDGEITLVYTNFSKSDSNECKKVGIITLYLNHELNEEMGMPKSFNMRLKK